jgi:hypothetical protein
MPSPGVEMRPSKKPGVEMRPTKKPGAEMLLQVDPLVSQARDPLEAHLASLERDLPVDGVEMPPPASQARDPMEAHLASQARDLPVDGVEMPPPASQARDLLASQERAREEETHGETPGQVTLQ